MAQVLVVPVRVQGTEAAGEIAQAIHYVNNRADVDLIITGRGGGSREDLWAFNEEIVARAIYVSNIPVISAVGHEPDVTISDYVADLRASTPSNAAELAVPDQAEQRIRVEQLKRRLALLLSTRLASDRQRLERLRSARTLQNMNAPIEDRRMALAHLQDRMAYALSGRLGTQRGALGRLCAGLDAMSPLKVLARGYSVASREGRVVSRVEQVEPGDDITLLVSDGRLSCRVLGKEHEQ